MGRKDEFAVGDILTRKNGKQYLVVEASGCSTCGFNHKRDAWCKGMKCCPLQRSDSKEIVFRRIPS